MPTLKLPDTKPVLVVATLLLLLILPGCREGERVPPGIVALVGQRQISIEEFKLYLSRNTGTHLAQIQPEAASPLLDQYINEVLLAEYAAANNLEVATDKVAEAVRDDAGSTVDAKRDELRRSALIKSIADSVPPPSDAEIAAFYNQHPDDFRVMEEVDVRQILVRNRETADQVLAELKAGGDFAALSAEFSTAPNADRGGQIGFVSRGQLPKIFEDVIFGLAPGEISEVVEADANFHIFAVESHSPTRTIPLEDVEGLIRAKLESDLAGNRISETLRIAEEAFSVTVLTRRLPFAYTGGHPVAENE